MLKRLGRATPLVALLESFNTCALGGPSSRGWKAPSITFLQRARLDPRVVYEETILRDGLDDVKVLYAPQCLFLTPDVVAKIKEFQAKGGILVADAQLLSALKPDIEVPVKYSTNYGRLFAFLKKRIASVSVDVGGSRPVATVARSGKLSVTMTVKDAEGKPVEALLPAEIRLYDGAGREIDGAGWVCLQGGTCTIEFVTNINDAAGDYRVVCRDRASGLTAERTIKVNLKTDATYMP